jgi:hypothetical protein
MQPPWRRSIGFGVTITLLHLRPETDQQFRAAYVSFIHRPDDVAEIERIIGCPVRIDAAWNGFAVSREAWQLPLCRRDPVLRSVLERHADEIAARLPVMDPVAIDVRRVLASRITKGDIEIQGVARALGTSIRSLQRRLAVAGVSYHELVESTRPRCCR